MEREKREKGRSPDLPNQQLAQAFSFTAAELDANRAGYTTWQQRRTLPINRWLVWGVGGLAAVTALIFIVSQPANPGDWEQLIPLVAFLLLVVIIMMVDRRGLAANGEQVVALCGRANLDYRQEFIQSYHRIEMIEHYTLQLSGYHWRFALTPQQYRTLSTGVPYRIYTIPGTGMILSIERVLSCK